MSKVFDVFHSKKGKKEFRNMELEEKAMIIQAAYNEKMRNVLTKEVANYIDYGMDTAYEYVYKNYVEGIEDIADEEYFEKLGKLLSFLREKHIMLLKKRGM